MLVKFKGTEPGLRLDLFLSSNMNKSRSQIQKLITSGHIRVDGKKVKKNYLLQGGEEILLDLPDEEKLEAEPMDLDVVYEDDYLALINKAPGLVMHPGAGQVSGTLVSGLLATGWPLSDLSGPDRPGIVHRLDKETSGLLVIAKDNKTHQYLQKEIASRRMRRIYWAMVEANPKWEELTVEGYLERNPRKPTTYRMADEGRYSRTYLRLLESYQGFSLLECELDTGRTHQIRVHLKSANLFLVGDRDYGVKSSMTRASRQLLHARRLEFTHPEGEKMVFEADLPGDFKEFIDKVK